MNSFLFTNKTTIIDEDIALSTTLEEPDFVSLIELGRKIFKTPYVYITRFNGDTLTVTSHIEFRDVDIPRNLTFCNTTIARKDTYVVFDAKTDDSFKDNPYVINNLKYRFYAGTPIFFPDGSIFGTFCIFDTETRDFSDSHKRMLKLLASQTASFLKLHDIAKNYETTAKQLIIANSEALASDAVLKTMHDGVLVHDKDGKIVSCNPAALRILRLEKSELINANGLNEDWKIFDEDNNQLGWQQLPPLVALKSRQLVENNIVGLDMLNGDRIWLKVSSTPLFQEGNKEPVKIVTSFTDITDSKNYNDNLQKLAKIADDANQSKSTFLANVSHEIRTPLNGVVGIADALSNTSLDPKQRDMVELIKSAGKTLGLLLNDVLDHAKIEAGQLTLENLPIDVKEVITAAALLVKFQADTKDIGFELSFTPGMHLNYYGDMVRIRQIITNLASNAVKFTSHGKVSINVEPFNNINGLDAAQGIKITVTDTGIGIKQSDLDNLFNRYTQADNTITRKYGGTGLGLSISKDLLDLMGGQIHVSSQIGIGSTFVATIPLAPYTEQETITNELANKPLPEKDMYYRVLLAEDHAVNQKVFAIITEPFGFETTVVSNGRDALEAVKKQKFDLVFMDIKMPILDGIEATKAIREYEHHNNLSHTNIVMLSANTESSYSDLATSAGADYFLGKPIEIQAIIDLLQQIEDNEHSSDTKKLSDYNSTICK